MPRSYQDRLQQLMDGLLNSKDMQSCAESLHRCEVFWKFMGRDAEKTEDHKLAENEFYTYVKVIRELYAAFPMELRPYFKKKRFLGLVEKRGKMIA